MAARLTPVLALALALPGEGRGPATPPCPEGFAPDARRAAAVTTALRGATEGARLLAALDAAGLRPRYCFGAPPVTVATREGVVWLDARWPAAESAARAGHLLLHVVERTADLVDGARGRDCDARVALAVAGEARAIALELRLRRALAVRRARVAYPFEADFWRAPPAGREALVRGFVVAHPDGAPGLDALVTGYAARCRR